MRETDKKNIYTELREAITLLKLLPGEELSTEKLKAEYGVSRSPLRDAFLRLESDRLVEIFPQRCTRVTFLDEAAIEEERFMRKCVELGVIEKCMKQERTSKEREAFIIKLESNLLCQKAAILEEDLNSFYKADDDLHHLFYTEAGLENVWTIIDAHTSNDKRIRMLSYSDCTIIDGVRAQHTELIEAIKDNNIDRVLDIERKHLEKVSGEFTDLKEKFPDYFIPKRESNKKRNEL